MLARYYAVVLRLSICLSQISVLLKRLNVGSRKQSRTIARYSPSFLTPNISNELALRNRQDRFAILRLRKRLFPCFFHLCPQKT